jgi:holo-[acyl-carrier protein] synthase
MIDIGVDIAEVNRFDRLSQDVPKMSKIFTLNEIKYFEKFAEKSTHIAGAFCAKEAVVKALKLGFGDKLSPKDVEILHEDSGAPFVSTNNEKLQKQLSGRTLKISISHSKTQAIAVCIVEK